MTGKEKGKHVIPSGCITDKDGICNAQKLVNDETIERDDLNCIEERQRHIPVHRLAYILGTEKSRPLLKAHILTVCDVTSKIGSKTAVFKACPEKYLYDFGE